MNKGLINGIHHVTAMAGDPQVNLDFYAGLLGLRLVKKTVNFDAPDVYHLYYGDETGQPGSIMTFFPFGAGPYRGQIGNGQAAVTSFSIPSNALDFWIKRLDQYGVPRQEPRSRFQETALYFTDPDGLGLELVANDLDTRPAFSYGHIPVEFAIRGFWGTEIWESRLENTEHLLTSAMNYQFLAETQGRRRYAPTEQAQPGRFVDILWDPQKRYGQGGIGTVHHIAFDTPSDESQLELRSLLLQNGQQPTQVIDRQYFHSIYFREPGGVLFEVATTPPGFALDESVAELGQGLKLPAWEEYRREKIEKMLLPISLESALAKYPG